MLRAAILSSCALVVAAQVSIIESGASGAQWATMPAQSWSSQPPSSGLVIAIDLSQMRQEVFGFGSAFTDTSAYNAMVYMTPGTRATFTEALWGETGLRASVGRVHINSPDYAVHTYNMDNVTDDFALAHFDANLTYDEQRVLPLIREAQAKVAAWGGAPIRLFASPWSPPGWMKSNNNMINSDAQCLKNDTAAGGSYRQAWASYIGKWLQAFAAHGAPMWGLTPQNEPEARQSVFESCAYTVSAYLDFVRNYLIPTVLPMFPNLQIMAYDHNKLDSVEFAEAIANDPAANRGIAGTAVHWYDYTRTLGLEQLDAVHSLSPNKFVLATEACFLDSLEVDWTIGFLYAADVVGSLRHWVSGWVFWNSVLLTGDRFPESRGGPNHDNTTHFGDPILFEFNATGTQRLVLQPSYWVLGHFSRALRPGSFVVPTSGYTADSYTDFEAVRNYTLACWGDRTCEPPSLPLLSVGFADPVNGVAGVIVANINHDAVEVNIKDVSGGGRYTSGSISAQTIRTYTWNL